MQTTQNSQRRHWQRQREGEREPTGTGGVGQPALYPQTKTSRNVVISKKHLKLQGTEEFAYFGAKLKLSKCKFSTVLSNKGNTPNLPLPPATLTSLQQRVCLSMILLDTQWSRQCEEHSGMKQATQNSLLNYILVEIMEWNWSKQRKGKKRMKWNCRMKCKTTRNNLAK